MNASVIERGRDGSGADRRGRFGGQGGASNPRLAMIDNFIDRVAPCPWEAHAGGSPNNRELRGDRSSRPLYTPEERMRRDASPWTIVQGVLAPIQFVAFAISLGLVLRYLATGEGYRIATASILIKTLLLYTIMVTGSIWEKVVFGKWLFARAFFWEDVFSMLVLGLQTAYLVALITGWGTPGEQMLIAVAAYGAYVINATQFLLKLRVARLEGAGTTPSSPGQIGQPA